MIVPCLVAANSRRGRRYPVGAHTGAVALRVDCPAVLAQGVRRATRYAHCVHFARSSATSQMTKRAARTTPWAVLLGAPEIAPTGYRLPRGCMGSSSTEYNIPCKGAWALGAARLWSAGKHRSCGLARSAIRKHFRRACLNAVRVAHAVSCATGRKSAHRRVVGRSTDRSSEALGIVPTRLCRRGHRLRDSSTCKGES